ncbi:MAG: response regulator, partial [Ekhidna sp.]
PNLRHIPVHIISAEEKRLDLFKLGAVEYITKPVKKEQLNQAFERIENFANRKMKNLLVIEDDNNLRRSIIKLIGNGDVQCLEASSAADALEVYKNEQVDCMVMDLGLPDMSGFELIKKMEGIKQGQVPPIIIYTGKELTKKQSQELEQYAETIIVKGVKSEERLLDETALFLHRTVKNLPPQKQEIITSLYDKDKVFQGKKVLVVDDDMRNVFALSKVLTERGFEIIKGDTGKAALEQLKHHSDVDIVLMDIMMPEMDGYECMQEIRKQKKFKELPIISLTAKAMKDDRQKCIDAGASDYISKPVDVDRLLSLMRIWLSK